MLDIFYLEMEDITWIIQCLKFDPFQIKGKKKKKEGREIFLKCPEQPQMILIKCQTSLYPEEDCHGKGAEGTCDTILYVSVYGDAFTGVIIL